MTPAEMRNIPSIAIMHAFIQFCNDTPFIPIQFELEIPDGMIQNDQKYILISNHGGWLGIEILILYSMAMWMEKDTETLADIGFVINPIFKHIIDLICPSALSIPSTKLRDNNDKRRVIIMFPEGENGTCKSSITKGYQCQPFKTGFLHLAKKQKRNIMVMTVTGHEEAFPSAGAFHFTIMDHTLDLPCPFPIPPYLGLISNLYKIKIHECISHEEIEPTNEFAIQFHDKLQLLLDNESSKYPIYKISQTFKDIDQLFSVGFSL